MRAFLYALPILLTVAPAEAYPAEVDRARASFQGCVASIAEKEAALGVPARRVVNEPPVLKVATITTEREAFTLVCDGQRAEMVVLRRPRD